MRNVLIGIFVKREDQNMKESSILAQRRTSATLLQLPGIVIFGESSTIKEVPLKDPLRVRRGIINYLSPEQEAVRCGLFG